MNTAVSVRGMDHIVLNVADAERAMAWYRDRLGLEPLRFEEWKAGEVPFLSLRVNDKTLIDLQVGERTGANMDHVALWVEDDEAAITELVAHDDVEVVMELDSTFGAQGYGPSVYIKDPDGNTVELKRYRGQS